MRELRQGCQLSTVLNSGDGDRNYSIRTCSYPQGALSPVEEKQRSMKRKREVKGKIVRAGPIGAG